MGSLTYTYDNNSNLVSFKSAARVPVTETKFHFAPKQDLHGYSTPWPAGGGKNLYDISTNPFVTGGIIGSTGVTNNNTQRLRCGNIKVQENTTYTISFTGKVTQFLVFCYDENDTYLSENGSWHWQSSGENFTTETNTEYIKVVLAGPSNDTDDLFPEDVSNFILSAGTTVVAWEPYENICPIEGWTNIEGNHSGKNLGTIQQLLGDRQYETVTEDNRSCVLVRASGGTPESFINAFKENTCYTISFDAKSIKSASVESDPTSPFRIYLVYTDDTTDLIDINLNLHSNWSHLTKTSKANKTIKCLRLGSFEYRLYVYFDINTFQIEEGTAATSYEQYQGETIPIIFPGIGKNLFNYNDIIVGKEILANGNFADASTWGVANYIRIKPNTNYVLSNVANLGSAAGVIYDINKTRISSFYAQIGSGAVTNIATSADAAYIRFTFRRKENEHLSCQLEEGTEATTYEPFRNTVYGGYVDLINGEVVATTCVFEINHNTSLKSFGVGHNVGRPEYDLPYVGTNANALCSNKFALRARSTASWNYPQKYALSLEPNDNLTTSVIIGAPENIITQEDWLTWLEANGPITVAYELATPIHYLMPQTELKTYIGQNNFWSNSNSKSEITTALYQSSVMRAAAQRIAANQPHIKTTTPADIATFNSDIIAPLKQVKINFSPKQEGSGDPSPSNIRNITGWTGLSIHHRNANLISSNASFIEGKWKPESGVIKTGSAYKAVYFPVPKGTLYFKANARGSCSYMCLIDEPIQSNVPVYQQVTITSRVNSTFDNSDGHLYMAVFTGTDNTFLERASEYEMIITTDSATTYMAPQNSSSTTLDWSSNIGTIYGGYVDLINGNVVQEYIEVDLGSVNWVYNSRNSVFYTQVISDMIYTSKTTFYCSAYSTNSFNIADMPDKSISNSYQLRARALIIKDSDMVGKSESEFKTAMSGIKVVYQLDNPITYTLTPTQLSSLKGVNNIWGTTNGVTEIKYWSH